MSHDIFKSPRLRLKLLAAIIICLPLAILGAPPPLAAQVIDRVVASVNGEVITLSELNRELSSWERQFLPQIPVAERERARTEARRRVLSGMIDNLLVEQQAAKRRIFVGEREIDQALAQVLAENRITKENLLSELQQAGITLADYRKTLGSQILQSRLLGLEVRERIVIAERKIREYYEQNHRGKPKQKVYHLLQMGFSWPTRDDQAREETYQRALRVREKVLAGGDFQKLAREFSDLPSGPLGGDLGKFKKEELAEELRQQILALSPGELTPVLTTARGFQFFQLLSYQDDASSQPTYEELREKIKEKLYRQALEEQFARWVANLRAGAYIRIML